LADKYVRDRPIVIDADALIDWAVWTDRQGIVEGGQTNTVAFSQGKTSGRFPGSNLVAPCQGGCSSVPVSCGLPTRRAGPLGRGSCL
jgi:hypothetical protein